MDMKESSDIAFDPRYTVVLTDTDLITGEVCKTDLRFFDEFSDACVWIKNHGSMYASRESNYKKFNRFFRIEKRYYIV